MRVQYGIAVYALILCGCAPEAPTTVEAESHEVHWGYEGDEGPERWADLSPEFATCRNGTEQSPIDLTNAMETQLPIMHQCHLQLSLKSSKPLHHKA